MDEISNTVLLLKMLSNMQNQINELKNVNMELVVRVNRLESIKRDEEYQKMFKEIK
jgi:formyltetrahydrofolate synthetase